MKKIFIVMKPFLIEISHDFMMTMCLIVPILMGTAFKIGIPFLENLLCSIFKSKEILYSYFLIFDLILTIMTPIMFTFSGVMTVLTELDNGTAKALCVTPVGKSGYIISRIIIPSVASFFYDIILLKLFSITNIHFWIIINISLISTFLSTGISLLVISLAKNKLEGMALIKTCGLFILGIPIVYFIPGKIQYLFSILPSFWLTKFAITESFVYIFPALISCILWISLFGLKFKHKLV